MRYANTSHQLAEVAVNTYITHDGKKLTWLNHGIPTLIARKLESTVDSAGWETL